MDTLHISDNFIETLILDNRNDGIRTVIIRNCSNLKSIDISYLNSITELVIYNNNKLNIVNCRSLNNIEYLDIKNVFRLTISGVFCNLKTIILSDVVNSNLFMDIRFSNVKSINFTRCYFIKEDFLRIDLNRLEELSIIDSKLYKFNLKKKLPILKKLNLSYNRLSSLIYETELNNILELNLSHNNIVAHKLETTIKDDTKSFQKIKILYVNDNNMTYISNKNEFLTLSHLYLQNNKFKYISLLFTNELLLSILYIDSNTVYPHIFYDITEISFIFDENDNMIEREDIKLLIESKL